MTAAGFAVARIRSRTWAAALLLFTTAACDGRTPASDTDTAATRALIVGQDDRREAYQVADRGLADGLGAASVALVYAHRVRFEADRPTRLAPTLGSAMQLCAGEEFAEQPSWAFCSGTLIDRELVLTAGHCLGTTVEQANERCPRIRMAFGYQLAADGTLPDPADDDVYACRSVVVHQHSSTDPHAPDYAIIQLDRAVNAARQPAVLATRDVAVGDRVTVAAYGAGLPLKIELAAAVTGVSGAGRVVAGTDTFAGASGGGVYDAAGELIALHVGGGVDWAFAESCRRAETVASASERQQHTAAAVAALRARAWPSARLTGIAPRLRRRNVRRRRARRVPCRLRAGSLRRRSVRAGRARGVPVRLLRVRRGPRRLERQSRHLSKHAAGDRRFRLRDGRAATARRLRAGGRRAGARAFLAARAAGTPSYVSLANESNR